MAYHDKEWGRPLFDDKKIYQAFLLDTFQAGLSWAIILSKRNNFRKAFANFNVTEVAQFGRGNVKRLLSNSGIIRNRRKIEAIISNSKKILELKKEFGSFAQYLWKFTKAGEMAKDMKARGFRFTGPTTIYAFMQGIGMVNDHLVSCFAYQEVKKASLRRF